MITDLWLYGGPWLWRTLAIAALGYGRHKSAVLRPSGGVLRPSSGVLRPSCDVLRPSSGVLRCPAASCGRPAAVQRRHAAVLRCPAAFRPTLHHSRLTRISNYQRLLTVSDNGQLVKKDCRIRPTAATTTNRFLFRFVYLVQKKKYTK